MFSLSSLQPLLLCHFFFTFYAQWSLAMIHLDHRLDVMDEELNHVCHQGHLFQSSNNMERQKCPNTNNSKHIEAELYFSLGVDSLADGNYMKAIQEFLKCVDIDPKHSFAAHLNLAIIFSNYAHNCSKAIYHSEIAIEVSPFNTYLDRFMTHFSSEWSILPEYMMSHYTLARVYSDCNLSLKSKEQFEIVIEMSKTVNNLYLDPVLAFEFALVLDSGLNSYDDAKTWYESSLYSIQQTYPNIETIIDISYYGIRNYNDFINGYLYQLYYRIGSLIVEQFDDDLSELKKAKIYLEESIKWNDKFARSHFYYGMILMNEKLGIDYINALKQFEISIELDENYYDAYNNVGWICATYLNDFQKAKKMYKKCIKINEKDTHCYLNLAALMINQFHDYRQGLKYTNMGIKNDPNDSTLQMLKSQIEELIAAQTN